jgi:5-methylcytosine-specific restriction endonuclease McrA
MRKAVRDRDQGVCAIGGPACDTSRGAWQADHIIPVIEGGGECGLENMRTLCTQHHNEATKALAGRRAEARRKAKEQPPE